MTTRSRYVSRGLALRNARLANGQTQRWVADAARVHERTVMRAEKGGDLSPENLLSVCAALSIDRNALPGPDEKSPLATDEPPHSGPAQASCGRRRVLVHAAAAALLVAATAGVHHGVSAVEVHRRALVLQDVVRSNDTFQSAAELARLVHSYAAGGASKEIAESSMRRLATTYDRCDRSTFIDLVLMQGCPVGDSAGRVVSFSTDVMTIEIGPLTRTRQKAMLTQLPYEKDVVLRVASSTAPDASPDALVWTDPLGGRAASLGSFPDGAWLLVDVRKTGARS